MTIVCKDVQKDRWTYTNRYHQSFYGNILYQTTEAEDLLIVAIKFIEVMDSWVCFE